MSGPSTIGSAHGTAEELPPWRAILGMLGVVALIAAALIALCFLAASLAT